MVAGGHHLLLTPLLSLPQVVHLDNMTHEEELQKLPLQPPYYDMAASEPSAYTDKLVRGAEDSEHPPQPHCFHPVSLTPWQKPPYPAFM